ncbi:hypothetical protein LCGC14_2441810 [marine sediment metagenome]|uniref:Uncharacterized protein n=1 Tax=marine sediment metagenome TaxID=412755 RepID=A0A0F9BIX5_9ZZZZ
MGFKKEVRAFMANSGAERSLVKQLQKQNQDLMDRLMARDFSELKTYNPSFPDGNPKEKEYDPTEDETSAGDIIE